MKNPDCVLVSVCVSCVFVLVCFTLLPSSFFFCPTGLLSASLLLLLNLFSFNSTPCRQVLSSAATRVVSSRLVQ